MELRVAYRRDDQGGLDWCVFCGRSEATAPVQFTDTYTAYQFLQSGSKACERCANMLGDSKFRRRNFVVKDDTFIAVESPLDFLDAPSAEPPFVLYLTRQHRKHGWVLAVQNPVLNLDRFVLIVDEDKLVFERTRYEELRRFSESLFERKVPKKAMVSGYPWASVIRKYHLSHEEAARLRDLQGDELWKVCVDFKRRKKRG
jgi:hypothetical protein